MSGLCPRRRSGRMNGDTLYPRSCPGRWWQRNGTPVLCQCKVVENQQFSNYLPIRGNVRSQATSSALERRYQQTGLESGKQAYILACSVARDRLSILKSRADHIKSELDEASSDIRATWRTAQRLLHSRHEVMYNDAQYTQLVLTFWQYFVDKVSRIRNVSATLDFGVIRPSNVCHPSASRTRTVVV